MRLTLADDIARRHWVFYGPAGEGAFAETYRENIAAHVRELADTIPALARLRNGEDITDAALDALSQAVSQADFFVTEATFRNVYGQRNAGLTDFVKHIFGTAPLRSHEADVRDAFDAYMAEHPEFSASQLNFPRTVRSAVIQGMRLSPEALDAAPFSRIGNVRRLFADAEIGEIIGLSRRLAG